MSADTQVNSPNRINNITRKTKQIVVDSYTAIGAQHYVRCLVFDNPNGRRSCVGRFDCISSYRHDSVIVYLVADDASGNWAEMTAVGNVSELVFGGGLHQETSIWARETAKAAVRKYLGWKQPRPNHVA